MIHHHANKKGMNNNVMNNICLENNQINENCSKRSGYRSFIFILFVYINKSL